MVPASFHRLCHRLPSSSRRLAPSVRRLRSKAWVRRERAKATISLSDTASASLYQWLAFWNIDTI
jgi:hypothetical protein